MLRLSILSYAFWLPTKHFFLITAQDKLPSNLESTITHLFYFRSEWKTLWSNKIKNCIIKTVLKIIKEIKILNTISIIKSVFLYKTSIFTLAFSENNYNRKLLKISRFNMRLCNFLLSVYISISFWIIQILKRYFNMA